MGLRASELLNRKVRDLDDDCGILWVDQGKTCNARRHLRVPEFVRHHLRHLILSQTQDAYLFESESPGQPFRHQSLLVTVHRLCAKAGATTFCTHSLRGLYATLAVESGALSETVASSLGHSSFAMTERHYAQASSISNVKTASVDQLLTSGRGAEVAGPDVILQLILKMTPEQREQLTNTLSMLPHRATPDMP